MVCVCLGFRGQNFLRKYKNRFNKVASAMLTNEKLLHQIAREKKTTFISTGMSTIKDIDKALGIFKKYKCKYILMHCVSNYPCPNEKLNLNAIITLRKNSNVKLVIADMRLIYLHQY